MRPHPPDTASPTLWLSYPEDQLKASGLLVFHSLRDQFIFMLFTLTWFIFFHGTSPHCAADTRRPLLEVYERGLLGKNRKGICMLRLICFFIQTRCRHRHSHLILELRSSSGCWRLPRRAWWCTCTVVWPFKLGQTMSVLTFFNIHKYNHQNYAIWIVIFVFPCILKHVESPTFPLL